MALPYQGEIGTWINPQTGEGYSGYKKNPYDIPAPTQVGQQPALARNPVVPQPVIQPQSAPKIPVIPPQTTPTQSPQVQSPITKFNLALLDMLKKAQTGGGNENLYAQQTALQRAAIGRQSATTPEELRNLSPQQQSAIRSGQVSALEPEIDAVSAKIKAQDSRLSNFESILGTMKEFGQDIAKLTPSEETIKGYVDMLKQGGQPTAIPEEIRNTVMAKMTAADWAEWSRIVNEKSTSKAAADTVITDEGVMQWNPATSRYDIRVGSAKGTSKPSDLTSVTNTISTIDTLLKDPIVTGVVNKGMGTKLLPFAWERLGFKEKNYIASIEQMISTGTLNALINAKANGATFGALSDAELEILGASFSKIKTWTMLDDNGKVLGYSIDKDSFENELKRIKESANKLMTSLASTDSQSSGSSGTTVMIGPDGSKWNVPNNQIELFKQNGYK